MNQYISDISYIIKERVFNVFFKISTLFFLGNYSGISISSLNKKIRRNDIHDIKYILMITIFNKNKWISYSLDCIIWPYMITMLPTTQKEGTQAQVEILSGGGVPQSCGCSNNM